MFQLQHLLTCIKRHSLFMPQCGVMEWGSIGFPGCERCNAVREPALCRNNIGSRTVPGMAGSALHCHALSKIHMKKLGAFKARTFRAGLHFLLCQFLPTANCNLQTRHKPIRPDSAPSSALKDCMSAKTEKPFRQWSVSIQPPRHGVVPRLLMRFARLAANPSAGHNKAVNWTKFGKGCISRVRPKGRYCCPALQARIPCGHVYQERHSGRRVEVCGGNMSNRFKCSNYRASSVKAVRR